MTKHHWLKTSLPIIAAFTIMLALHVWINHWETAILVMIWKFVFYVLALPVLFNYCYQVLWRIKVESSDELDNLP